MERGTLEQHGNGEEMKEYVWNNEFQLLWDIEVVFHKLHLTSFISGVWKRLAKNVWVKVEV